MLDLPAATRSRYEVDARHKADDLLRASAARGEARHHGLFQELGSVRALRVDRGRLGDDAAPRGTVLEPRLGRARMRRLARRSASSMLTARTWPTAKRANSIPAMTTRSTATGTCRRRPKRRSAAIIARSAIIARRDEDGYIYLVDRKSNMIISGGENVYPSEVEALLGAHPKVKEVAVIGVADEKWGERVHAVIVARDGGRPTEAEIIEWCNGRIAGHKRPRSCASSAKTRCRARRPARFSIACCDRSRAPRTLIAAPRESGHDRKADAMTQDLNADEQSCAAWIARFLKARGIDRIFGLQGGHIQPIWDHVARQGIRIIDVRDEGAAVHMAHAHAELTGRLRRRHGHRRPGRDQHRHRHGQCLARTRARTLDRRLHVATAGQYGAAARYPTCRHSSAGNARSAHLARPRASRPRTRRGGRARDGRRGRAGPGLRRNSDRRAAHARLRRNSCSTNGSRPSRRGVSRQTRELSPRLSNCLWSAKRPLGHHRPRRARRVV